MIIALLVIQSLGLILASEAADCSLFLTQASCQHNNSCKWVQSNNQLCQNQVNCSLLNNQNDCNKIEKTSNCEWVSYPNNCNILADACQLNQDKSACNYPNSCIYNPVKQPTCTPKGNTFNCSQNYDSKTCASKPQCLWDNAACYTTNKCENLQKTDCKLAGQGSVYCKYVIKDCALTPKVAQACMQQNKNQQTCQNAGCVWDTGTAAKCVPPSSDKCYAVIPTDGSDPHCSIANENVCISTSGKCQTLNDVCSQKVGQCDQTDLFCSSCADNKDYCDVDTCEQKSDLCQYTPLIPQSCENNQKDNQCLQQTSFTSCLSLGYCDYQTDHCKSTVDCTLYTQNLCYQQDFCNWSNVYSCQQVSIPINSSQYLSSAIILSIILTIFL
ncbi:hypothetical protein TTHERM_00895700 (macronuclear) [Tetrahymena thermophila SB210]|uniref:Transmembrane protein n=1 Tax=Tetrahymena thermophila (strain SB210) TaxID=312017 RepID=Q22E57_TETTS|nr:hypothetical protein TTHERM_00895700 [Tetrahymena thermophila SB210]EAR83557.1 hypothetical protein TTHERM_00895700 [Tetrahymena thermophila SB210]|eukprot:XP_001031220.1 hypothetical protein TTHERM_00895700 [Tetrahymena thermophila SB210]